MKCMNCGSENVVTRMMNVKKRGKYDLKTFFHGFNVS